MYIDAIGQPCPIPVIKAKKALSELPPEGGEVQILVDNLIACENLEKMARGMGYVYSMRQNSEDEFIITIATSGFVSVAHATKNISEIPTSGLVVSIGQSGMGRGDDALGKILIKGFIFSLTQLSPPPRAVLMFNSGILLAVDGSNTIEDLKALAEMGVKIGICGTCADYYAVKDKIMVGEIINMYDITKELASAGSIMNI